MLTTVFVVYPHGTSKKHLRSFTVRLHIQVNSKRNKTEQYLGWNQAVNNHRASYSALMSSGMLDGGEEQDKALMMCLYKKKKRHLSFPFSK